MANFIALELEKISKEEFNFMHTAIFSNLKEDDFVEFDFNFFVNSLKKDKKNYQNIYRFIIPFEFGRVRIVEFPMDKFIESIFSDYFVNYYRYGVED